MSSRRGVPVNAPAKPAYLWVPPRVGSYGDEAVELARLAGRELDADQVLAVDAMLSYGPGGRPVALEAVIIEARQNGKTGGVLLPVVLFDLWLGTPDRVVWTAHLFRTARDAFADVCACIERTAELSRRVKKVTYGNGEESVLLHSGAQLDFLARSQGGGRGLGGKRLVMDEALFLSGESMGALIPTLSARQEPQINYGASAGVAASGHLRRLRDRGRPGGDPSLIYIEHCAPGSWASPGCAAGVACPHVAETPGCVLDDEDQWPFANPSLGRRITYDYVRSERRALPPREFGRERFGWWDDPAAEGAVIDAARWAQLVDPGSAFDGAEVYGIDVAPNRDWASVAVAGLRDDGQVHAEIGAHKPGTEWIVEFCRDLQSRHPDCTFVIDKTGPGEHLLRELEDADLSLVELTTPEVRKACGLFMDAVTQGTVRHHGQPALDAAVAGARPRLLGDGVVTFSRKKSDVDISPLYAVTLAHWVAAAGDYDVLDSIY